MLQCLNAKFQDPHLVKIALTGLAEIFEGCHQGSPLRDTIRTGLGSPMAQGQPSMLEKVGSAHMSHYVIQSTIMWVLGVIGSCAAVLQQMEQQAVNEEVQLFGIKTLGTLYHDMMELTPEDQK